MDSFASRHEKGWGLRMKLLPTILVATVMLVVLAFGRRFMTMRSRWGLAIPDLEDISSAS